MAEAHRTNLRISRGIDAACSSLRWDESGYDDGPWIMVIKFIDLSRKSKTVAFAHHGQLIVMNNLELTITLLIPSDN